MYINRSVDALVSITQTLLRCTLKDVEPNKQQIADQLRKVSQHFELGTPNEQILAQLELQRRMIR